MKSRYFTKIIPHLQAVGKVFCYCVVKDRTDLTNKITKLFGKLTKTFRCAPNNTSTILIVNFLWLFFLLYFYFFFLIFFLFRLCTGAFPRNHCQSQFVASVCFFLQSLETIDLELFYFSGQKDRIHQLRELLFG